MSKNVNIKLSAINGFQSRYGCIVKLDLSKKIRDFVRLQLD